MNGDASETFQLKRDLDFAFEPHVIEVDLLSTDLHIAIEIDGSFHFTDLDARRRGRRKDLVAVMRVVSETLLPYTSNTNFDEEP